MKMTGRTRHLIRHCSGRPGITLSEMTVVVAIAALLVALTLPAAKMLINSFESESGTKAMISSALASARAIAAKEQRYAGIRFQKAGDPNNALNAPQYMIFIIQDPDIMAYGFKAVEDIEPIKLPDSIGIMDTKVRTNRGITSAAAGDITEQIINNNIWIDDPNDVLDATAFSVIFSPSGKLVIHQVRTRNKDGDFRPINLNDSADDIFNSPENIRLNKTGMFVQDDYAYMGLGAELSRTSFIIYETEKFKQAYNNGNAWSGYLNKLVPVHINPYTGTIIGD